MPVRQQCRKHCKHTDQYVTGDAAPSVQELPEDALLPAIDDERLSGPKAPLLTAFVSGHQPTSPVLAAPAQSSMTAGIGLFASHTHTHSRH